MATLRWGAATDAGRIRSTNQDAFLAAPERDLYLLADGMGGPQGGEVAAHLAVETVRESFEPHSADSLVEAIHTANTEIYRRGVVDASLRGMGTTLVAVALVDDDEDEEVLAIANVGDSRIYRLTGTELEQLTDDHSLVADLVRAGRLSPEEAEVHPQRNIITRALGVYERIQVDAQLVDLHAGHRYLLCSDGLFNEVELPQIAAVLRRLDDPSDAARELVRLANEGGGRDNVTCVVVDVVDDDQKAARASRAVGRGRRGSAAPAGVDDEALDQAFGRAGRPAGTPARRRRRPTWRAVAFVALVLAVVAGGAGTVWWYARHSYYVGYDGTEVVVYQGRPGGMLWFDPTVEERTGVDRDEVPPEYRDALVAGREQPSLGAARRYVANMQDRITELEDERDATTTTTTPNRSTTTSTTRA